METKQRIVERLDSGILKRGMVRKVDQGDARTDISLRRRFKSACRRSTTGTGSSKRTMSVSKPNVLMIVLRAKGSMFWQLVLRGSYARAIGLHCSSMAYKQLRVSKGNQ